MRLARIGDAGQERPVVVGGDGTLLDLASVTADITADFLGDGGLARAADAMAGGTLVPIEAPADVRLGPPIRRPTKILCIGLNYAQHAAETGADLPTEPVLFTKAANAVVGPNDTVLIPRGCVKLDHEVELAVIVGAPGRYLDSPEHARDIVAGYAISNDVSARDFQLERGGQWVKGKSAETFNPLGPWLVTGEDVPDPQSLELTLSVNGVVRQHSTTADMIFDVMHLVWYLSQFLVLEPGDVINTGTPAGVAMGFEDPPWLHEGDVMELAITGLGAQRQVVGRA